jgi:hypothetical protein
MSIVVHSNAAARKQQAGGKPVASAGDRAERPLPAPVLNR